MNSLKSFIKMNLKKVNLIFFLIVIMNVLLKQLTTGNKEYLFSFLNIVRLFLNNELSFQSWVPFLFGNFMRYGIISVFYTLIIISTTKMFFNREEHKFSVQLNFVCVFRITIISALLVSLTYGIVFYIASEYSKFIIKNPYISIIVSNINHLTYVLIIFNIISFMDKGVNLISSIIRTTRFLFSKSILLMIILIVAYSLFLLMPINILYLNQMNRMIAEGLIGFFDVISFKIPFWYIISNIISDSILYLILFTTITYIYYKNKDSSSDSAEKNQNNLSEKFNH